VWEELAGKRVREEMKPDTCARYGDAEAIRPSNHDAAGDEGAGENARKAMNAAKASARLYRHSLAGRARPTHTAMPPPPTTPRWSITAAAPLCFHAPFIRCGAGAAGFGESLETEG
jgi:hypothetical protein